MLLLVLSCSLLLSETSASVPLPTPVSGDPDPAKVTAALKEFSSLSGKERRQRFRAVKSAVKQFKAEKRAGREPLASTVVQVIVAILLPPLGVYLHEGTINSRFWISLLLTLLFYLPGLIYALVIILGDN
ncbi:YqaE/Pmp3 family membrane protein [Flaviaesturariibacter aridisoli]|uniref:YqaE/Pmp3 family membrane protein n=2 Tax=Flaviaesturariibacter aridisoli TaxID=2545761 RepID=A0A4V2WMQ4_9BACT|nr:YqaE/Pmp3 family membrane protein [Flaviaesturariibacter aridisoli]